jgi:uncharacterized membrane protein YbhN (UPF0104 family)
MRTLVRSRLARLLASLALLCGVLWLVDAQASLARLRAADWRWLLLAFAMLHGVTILQALRWCVTARALGLSVLPGRAVGEYYLAQLVNQTLPGGVLGDVARAIRVREGKDWATAAESVVIERALGQVAMLALAVVGLCFALLGLGSMDWPQNLSFGLLVGVATLGTFAFLLRHHIPAHFGSALRKALLSPGMPAAQISLSVSGAALTVAAFWATAKATGTSIALADAALLIPLILSAMIIPLGIAGWGWREGAAAVLFPLIGAGADAGVATGIAYGTLLLAASLPGALWPFRRGLEPNPNPSNP